MCSTGIGATRRREAIGKLPVGEDSAALLGKDGIDDLHHEALLSARQVLGSIREGRQLARARLGALSASCIGSCGASHASLSATGYEVRIEVETAGPRGAS